MEIIKNCFRNIFRKKTRSLLTILGVAIGVMSVVIITSIGDVGKEVINKELNSMGIDGLTVGVDQTTSAVSLTDKELSIINGDSNIKKAMPIMMQFTKAYSHSKETKCVVLGVDEKATEFASLKVLYGRMINSNDVLSESNVCVVDESYAKMMYSRSNIVGKKVEISLGGKTAEYEVCGVVSSGGNVMQNIMGNIVPTFLYLPFSTVQSAMKSNGCDQILVQLSNKNDSELIGTELKENLNKSLQTNAVNVNNITAQKKSLDGILNAVTVGLAAIAGVSLFVAGLSIMTVMLISVNERTKEIGIKKAIGATRFRIMLEFLVESASLCTLGALVGIVLGCLIAYIGCNVVGASYVFNGTAIGFCATFSIFSGILFGVYPAQKAAKLSPSVALSC